MEHEPGRPPPTNTWTQDLPPSILPLGELRHWLAEVLTCLHEDDLLDVQLICTELVSNSYDHARGPRCLHVHLADSGASVRIEVRDASPAAPPVLGRSRLASTRGRGMLLVDRIATRWGTVTGPGEKTVWAELALVPTGDPAPSTGHRADSGDDLCSCQVPGAGPE